MDNSKMHKFMVTQLQLGENIPSDLKGKDANIAIIDCIGKVGDNGFQSLHHTFKGKEIEFACFGKKGATYSIPPRHATQCAGIAVGEPFTGYGIVNNEIKTIKYEGGVAPKANAKLFLIDTLDESAFLEALTSIEQENKYDVVSISLGYDKDDPSLLIKNKLIQLSASTLIVVSAGNYGSVKGCVFPATLDEVISVGCLGEYGEVVKKSPDVVDIFCYGEVSAPAIGDSNCLLQWATGTSLAAPAIAGLICLIMQCAKNGKYLPIDNKEDVLSRIKEKKNMLHLLKKMVTKNTNPRASPQVKPAEFLKKAYDADNFKKWFDREIETES